MRHWFGGLGCALLVAAPLAAQQADSAGTLDPVVVTATRVPTPASALAQPVTVLKGADLEAQGILTVADALEAVPGSTVAQYGSIGGVTSLFVRGGQSNYAKILVDGVPVNDPGGSYYYLSNLTTDNIDRIEIVPGPGSVLYGSDAVTGVVQIFTRSGNGPGQADFGVEGGTYNTQHWQVAAGGGSETVHYSASVSRLTSDGIYAFNNNYQGTPASALVRLTPDSNTDATVSLHYDDFTYHYPTNGAGVPDDSAQESSENGPTVGVDLGHRFSPSIETRLALGFNSADELYTDLPDGANFLTLYRSADVERRGSADLHTNVATSAGVVTVGVAEEAEHDEASDLCQTESPFADCSTPTTVESRLNSAAYVQIVHAAHALAFTAGLRFEDNQYYGTYLSYRGGVSYPLGRDTRVRASVGTGFREPSFAESYGTGPSTGNPALQPEHSFSSEIGLERLIAGGRGAVQVTGFLQRFGDIIDYNEAAAPGAPNYSNIAGAVADGVELTARIAPTSGVSVGATYTYLYTDVTTGGFDTTSGAELAAGQPLVRRPANAARLDASYAARSGAGAWLSISYVGSRADQDFTTFPATRVTLPAYGCVDLAAHVPLVRSRGANGLSATLRIDNLLDASYDEIEGFPASGRTVYFGARVGVGY